MKRGSDVDVRGEPVVCNWQAAVPCQSRDLHGLGETATTREIHLNHIDTAPVHQVQERLPVAFLFAGRDAHICGFGQLAVTVVVIGTQWLFEPEDAVFRKSPGALQRGFGIPYQAGVDEQIGSIAQTLASFTHQRDIGTLVLSHGVPAEFHSGESLVAIAAGQVAGFLGCWAEQRAGIAAHRLVEAAPQQFPDRQLQRFAFDVPQRQVDTAHGVQTHAATAAINVGAVHFVPNLFGLEWIFADHYLPQTARRRMRERPVNRALDGHGSGIHLADSGNSSVGLDAHNERILAAVALKLHLRLAQINGLNPCDLHDGRTPIIAKARKTETARSDQPIPLRDTTRYNREQSSEMTSQEELHRLVERLPEEESRAALRFLEYLCETAGPLLAEAPIPGRTGAASTAGIRPSLLRARGPDQPP